MASLYTQQSRNVFRTWMLMSVFLLIVTAVGWLLSQYFQNPAIVYVALVFAFITNVWSYWYSDSIAISSVGAIPADPVQYKELHQVVENLAITAGLPKPRVYIINDPAPNAFATGRDKTHAVIAVTTGLLGMMNRNELEGVIAHELSHVGNRDILVMTVAVVLVGFLSVLANIFLRMSFMGGDRENKNAGPIILIATVAAMILAPLAAQLIQLAISRKREYLADASGAILTRYPEGLESALAKLGSYEAPMQRASTTTAHLFITNPFGAHEAGQFVQKLFSTHPPIQDRIKALEGMNV
ncbi:MAG: HtpX2, heat shock protein HtpX, heat shock protein HtpX [Candidatus Kaiserbacteria bacterium]|nr:HtpX2, heat shock protein HtpX, heat shock protein HtpX [Candidatus Kaiserbacteria bacterium]